MAILARASFGWLLRHPWQLVPALAGVCIGVAVMVAVDLAVDSAGRAFELSMDAVNGQATHQVVGGPAGLDEDLYVELRVAQGLQDLAPVVEGFASADNVTLTLLGVDPLAEGEFRDYASPDSVAQAFGRLRQLLTGPGAVLLSARTAATLGVADGETFTIVVNGRELAARVAGFVSDDAGEADPRLDGLLITDIATAQEWLDRRGRLSRIDVRLAAGDAGARERLAAALPPDARLIEAAGRTRSMADMTHAFTTNLTAMSLLAMLVGVFLIYNSIGFAVLQRRSIFGTLRALGVTRRGLLGLVLGEAAVLGVIGAAAGVAAGVALGERLLALVARTINDLYFVVNVTAVTADPVSLAKGFAAGVAATLLAAALPVAEAAAVPPRLAMARAALEARARRMLPWLAVGGLVAAALAGLLLELSGRSLPAGLAALFLLVIGLALCIPYAVRWIAYFATPLGALAGGPAGRLAVAGIGASLSRTAVAIVALAVAISATVGVSVMIDSFRGAVREWVENTLRSDVYVGVDRGSLDPALVRELVQLPGIAAWSTSRNVTLETSAGRTGLTVLHLPPDSFAGIALRDADTAAVQQAFEDDGAVLASDSYAWRHGVAPGDSVPLPTANGVRRFQVAAIYQSYDSDLDSLLMSRRTYEIFWDDPTIDSLGLRLAPGVSVAAIVDELRRASAGRQALLVRSNREIRDRSMEIFERTFVITDVLYWLALGVAIVGMLAALLALQLERARELAILRALGVTPGELAAMVIGQGGCIGLLCGLAALPLGLLMASLLVEVINRRAFGWVLDLSVEPRALGVAVALALAAAIVAALYPARRAARASPALAMRED
ncbi:MAG TPA: FtsX-like permease family protein [Woeseiaceae bacterium]